MVALEDNLDMGNHHTIHQHILHHEYKVSFFLLTFPARFPGLQIDIKLHSALVAVIPPAMLAGYDLAMRLVADAAGEGVGHFSLGFLIVP